MPHVFDGFFFDLLAFVRGRRRPNSQTQVQPLQADAGAGVKDDERLQRQQDEVVFWGLHAFPVLW